VQGEIEEHEFDLGVANGRVLLGVLDLSFESQSPQDSLRNLRAAAWTIDDTKNANPDLSLAVVMLPRGREAMLTTAPYTYSMLWRLSWYRRIESIRGRPRP
jgi:hypothetical protein